MIQFQISFCLLVIPPAVKWNIGQRTCLQMEDQKELGEQGNLLIKLTEVFLLAMEQAMWNHNKLAFQQLQLLVSGMRFCESFVSCCLITGADVGLWCFICFCLIS